MSGKRYFVSVIFIVCLVFNGCVEKKTNAQSEKTNDKGITMNESGLEKATLGSGCFWCTEADIRKTKWSS